MANNSQDSIGLPEPGTEDVWMPDSEDLMTGSDTAAPAPVAVTEQDEDDATPYEPASARSIRRSTTVLQYRQTADVARLTVSLLGDRAFVPSLDDVDKVNAVSSAAVRTPLMTVVLAVLGKHGGSLTVDKLTDEVQKHWNRPFPPSPYTPMEFMYLTVRNAHDVVVSDS
jgi:hypothetical protein